MYIIYKLIFPNNKIFVGQTKKKFNQRLYQYKSDAYNEKRKSYNRFISKAIRKHGWNSIKKEIILYCEENQADYYERKLIKLYNSNNKLFGYNIESGGNRNKIVSEETKQKISNANRGKKRTKEHREKSRISHLGKPSGMLGKKHSKKTKELMKIKSPHLCGKNHSMWGRFHSEETKKLWSIKRTGKNNPMYGKKRPDVSTKLSKPINIYTKSDEYIKTFESITQASKELNIFATNICAVLKNKLKTTGGYKFKYA